MQVGICGLYCVSLNGNETPLFYLNGYDPPSPPSSRKMQLKCAWKTEKKGGEGAWQGAVC